MLTFHSFYKYYDITVFFVLLKFTNHTRVQPNINLFHFQSLEVKDSTNSRIRSRLLYVPNQYRRNEETNRMHRRFE